MLVITQKIETIDEKARLSEYLWGIARVKGGQNIYGTPLVSSGCLSAYRVPMLLDFGGFSNRTMAEDMDLTWTHLEKGYDVVLSESVCYPLDPDSYKIYLSQIRRWYRAFFQVLKFHNTKIFKRIPLAFFVIWSLVESFGFLLFLPFSIYWLITQAQAGLFVSWVIMFFGGNLIISIFSLLEAYKKKKLIIALKSLPSYCFVSPVNMVVFLESFWLECVVKKPLDKWEKGH